MLFAHWLYLAAAVLGILPWDFDSYDAQAEGNETASTPKPTARRLDRTRTMNKWGDECLSVSLSSPSLNSLENDPARV